MFIELTTIRGIPIIVIAIPVNLPIKDRASVWLNPAVTRHLGIISVESVLKILLKNPFRVSGRQSINILKRSCDLLSVFSFETGSILDVCL